MPSISEIQSDGFFGASSWQSTEPYITVFGLFTTFVYVIKHHKKHDWLTWLMLTLFVLYLTPFNGIFSGFSSLGYTRWAYGLNIMMILTVLSVICQCSGVTKKSALSYVGLCVVYIALMIGLESFFAHRSGSEFKFTERKTIESSLFVINCLCLIYWSIRRPKVNALILLVAICGCLNLFAFTHYNTNADYPDDKDFIFRHAFKDDFSENKSVFNFRVDAVTKYPNCVYLDNSHGVLGFHSSMNKKMIPIRSAVQGENLVSSPTFYCKRNRVSLDALFSVKEVRDFRDSISVGIGVSEGITLRERTEDCDIYDFDYYIPFGFAYESYVTDSDIAPYLVKPDSIDIPLLLLDNIVIKASDESAFSEVLKKGVVDVSVGLDSVSVARRQKCVADVEGDTKGFTCTSNFDSVQVIFFSVVSDPGFSAYIDGEPTTIYDVNLGLSAIIVPPGQHNIAFSYLPAGLKVGVAVTFLSLLALLLLYIKTGNRP